MEYTFNFSEGIMYIEADNSRIFEKPLVFECGLLYKKSLYEFIKLLIILETQHPPNSVHIIGDSEVTKIINKILYKYIN